ncbi:periplasmic chaperone for outer membrane proteins Skp [Poseidonocella pacifica]|uniref:Periplasmic chaperone for outer membrane proteins Skp n=1 Tax=Poseidonocella pacifica TaxID=871651 RepID=A0A1I0VUL9_9RHOB|nr:OmpH family outer membrane protein [Poseidonocella pacifica]SFA79376.1 periplasmic chaperone for outer membrane proteins Skp [Poseidonocella pacifica]
MRFLRAAAGLVAGVLLCGAVLAQEAPPQTPILTIETERFYTESLFGQRVAREIEEDSAALTIENREIEADLMEEEKRLTEERDRLDRESFQKLAEEFDTRVQAIRQRQDTRARELARRQEEAEREFLNAARPILGELMQTRGAEIIVERRSVFISAGSIDITDAAIERINEAIGDRATGD